MDSKHETIHRGKLTWDHQLLDKELEKLDAEIRETKSRMSRNLFSSLPHPADTDCVLSPLANSSRCSDNATSVLGVWSVSSTKVLATTEEKVDLPSAPEEDVGLQNIHDDRSELNTTALEGRTSRESDGSTLVAEILHANEKMVKSNVIMGIEEGDMVSANSVIDSSELDVELPLCTARNDTCRSLETSSCCVAKPHSDFSTEAIPSHPYVGKVEVCQMLPEPISAGHLTVLFKKEIKTHQEFLADSITGVVMEELLESELSDMLHGRVPSCGSSQLNRMKNDVLESVKLRTPSQGTDAPGAGRLQQFSANPNSHCRTALTSPVPTQTISEGCEAGSLTALLMTYDDYEHQTYFDFTTSKCSSPAVESPSIQREGFKVTSKRLVDKYVKETLEASGLLSSSILLELYASGKTLSLILGKQSFDDGEQEEKLYGRMLVEALCEYLDKKYLRFCLPSFFLFLEPCPEGPHLKQMLVGKVNEHADAACEGGFTLEYILEKSLDEEDWKIPYHDMMEVIHEISEHVMVDMIENILHDLMEMRPLTCGSQVTAGFMHSVEWEAVHC